MALDNYSPCPCGSGKKFKWCCQPIYTYIDKAIRQDAEGQHETALRTMDDLVAQHPENPEAWGRRAQLLYQNERVDEAEASLRKAFDVNPNYAFGHLLRGMFRQNEGEIPGALLLFRKAAELYDPDAKDVLGQVYGTIGDSELKMNRPVAARAAFQLALRCQPGNDELKQAFETLFGEKSSLPLSARREYAYLSLPSGASAEHRAGWDRALSQSTTGKLTDAAAAFDELTKQDAADAAAWYNLGLTRAWLGDNRNALQALDRYIEMEPDEDKAGNAAALQEVLRCGALMEDEANYVDHSVVYQLRDPKPMTELLQVWDRDRRLIVTQTGEQQSFLAALVLDAGSGLAGATIPLRGIGAYMMIIVDHLRIGGTNVEALERVQHEVDQRLGAAASPPRKAQRPANFNEVLSEALAFPAENADVEEAKRRIAEHVKHFFEDIWLHRPLRSLGMIAPLDAAGHPKLRKKVRGAVQFLQECALPSGSFNFDFDSLRHKLGLNGHAAPGIADISAMNAAELATLDAKSLADGDLEKAFQSATKLDARELADQFVRALIGRPSNPERPDRFPWYAFLVNKAVAEGDTQSALDFVNEGEKHDCEHNDGRRRNDYELRRGQIHAKRGETTEAQTVFERLVSRVPSELKYRATAAESLLSARQGETALQFAEAGLAEARKQNNRDSEGHFMELVEAAKRQQGN